MATRAVYLGLRSNVRFFASYTGFARLSTRLKCLSLLYDHLVLEDGVYEAAIGDNGSQEFVGPLVGDFQLRPLRNRQGTPFSISMARTGSDDYQTVMTSTNIQSYRAQFITSARELHAGKADWFTLGRVVPAYAAQAKKLADRWMDEEAGMADRVWPGLDPRVRPKVHKALNIDLATSAVMGAHLAPDGLHQPLLHEKALASRVELRGSGERALWVVLPEVATATWEDIAQLRRDKGVSDLRAKLAELDQAALEGADIYSESLGAALEELENHRPRWFGSGLWSVVNLVSGPLAPMLTAGAIGKSIGEALRSDRRWTATLLRGRQRLRQSAREQEWLRLS